MWAQIINSIIGLWLILSPGMFNVNKLATDNQHITGPVIMSVAIIALSESVRNVRYFNVLIGIWLLLAPWLLTYKDIFSIANSLFCGISIILLSLVKGKLRKRFGGGWRSLLMDDPPHWQGAELGGESRG